MHTQYSTTSLADQRLAPPSAHPCEALWPNDGSFTNNLWRCPGVQMRGARANESPTTNGAVTERADRDSVAEQSGAFASPGCLCEVPGEGDGDQTGTHEIPRRGGESRCNRYTDNASHQVLAIRSSPCQHSGWSGRSARSHSRAHGASGRRSHNGRRRRGDLHKGMSQGRMKR